MPLRQSVRRERRWFRPLRLEALEPLVLPGFLAPMHFDAGGASAPVVVGDFNGDGIPDLAVLHGGVRATVSVLLGNGNGSFRTPRTFDSGAFRPSSVLVGDFNGDGNLDLALGNGIDDLGYGENGTVLLGTGDGSFQAARVFRTDGTDPEAMAVGDFNGDGICDLAVAGPNTVLGTIGSVLLSNGDGSFQAPLPFWFPDQPHPTSMAVGDFNGDGTLDLAVTNDYFNTVSVLLGTGDGSFYGIQDFAAGSSPFLEAVGDFNGDGILDLVTDSTILLGNGDGTFQTPYNIGASGIWAVGDFNGDGSLDLAAPNYRSNTVSVLLGNGDGSFQPAMTYDAGGSAYSVAVGDFNGDGSDDLAASASDVSILLNDNSWPTAPRPGGQQPSDSRAAATAVEPRAAPALLPAPGVLPADTGMAVLGSPWAVTMAVPGPSHLPVGVDADQDPAAAAPAPSGAASPEESVGGALKGGPPALALLDRLVAESTSSWGGDLLGEQPWPSTL
jgi:hypothetical protein